MENVIVFLMQMQKFHTDPKCLLSHETHIEIKSCSKAHYLIYKVSIQAEIETCTVCFSLFPDSQHASDIITENYLDVKANILIWFSFPFEVFNIWALFQYCQNCVYGSWWLLMGVWNMDGD